MNESLKNKNQSEGDEEQWRHVYSRRGEHGEQSVR